MNILLSFGPFLLFAVLMRFGDLLFAMIAAAALSANRDIRSDAV
jgi:hypothetical protein